MTSTRRIEKRPLSLRSRPGRCPADREDGRDFPQGRTDRRAYTHQRQPQTHDDCRSHAVFPPALRRLDDRPHSPGRAPDRTGDGGVVRADSRTSPAPRTGLSGLPGDRPACRSVWRRTRRGGRRARHRNRRAHLWPVQFKICKSILDNNLDRRPAQKRAADGTPILHTNIRGPRYYN